MLWSSLSLLVVSSEAPWLAVSLLAELRPLVLQRQADLLFLTKSKYRSHPRAWSASSLA
jgi:hypothetical protein